MRVVHLLVAVLLGTCLALAGLYGSMFSSTVVLMWLVSALSAFLTSALLLEPFAVSYKSISHCSLDKNKLKDLHFHQNIAFFLKSKHPYFTHDIIFFCRYVFRHYI